MKKIAIMTTGGDCSGLNSVIYRVVTGGLRRGWRVIGIVDGTDGLCATPPNVIEFDWNTLPVENAHLAGSFLLNGNAAALNFATASQGGVLEMFNDKLRQALRSLELDGLILVGGNGSLSLAWINRETYADVSLVCIPKTIDLDVPLTDRTIGFDTAVQELTAFCDSLMMTARSHHRWFVVQAMGRDCGQLALNAGLAAGASAILIPEIKFDIDAVVEHVKNAHRDYGLIVVSEGVTVRGHSGRPADIIARKLTAAGIANRASYPEHIQRSGTTTAADRIMAARMADCALNAIENRETYVMTAMTNGRCETVPLAEFIAAGDLVADPKIPNVQTSNASVTPDEPLLRVARDMGVYVGETK